MAKSGDSIIIFFEKIEMLKNVISNYVKERELIEKYKFDAIN